jgi:plastocyanin
MRKLIATLAVASLMAISGAVALAATPSVNWKVGSMKTVKIKKGGTVKWVFAGDAPHNVKGPGFMSKTSAKKGFAFSRKFNAKGSFKIYCTVHPTTMKTTVKVG